MIHAKSAVIDGLWTMIGSSNLDTLSLTKNVELDVEINGDAVGGQMAALFREDSLLSTPFTMNDWLGRSRGRRIVTRLASKLGRWQ